MTKTKFLTIGVVILLILNFGTLTFLFTKKPPHPLKFEQEGPKKIIIERLWDRFIFLVKKYLKEN
ncbi:MAG: hypothetical protein KJ712_00640, partial [Bacteroidetes bacterium]|nr:hypothetical protein [Bacteroidota bacterium]